MLQDSKAFYGNAYNKAKDFAEGVSANLDAAFRFFSIALRNDGDERKVEMALKAACKHEGLAFPG